MEQQNRIHTMMGKQGLPYVLFFGGSDSNKYDPSTHTAHLQCDDSYAGLTSKTIAICQFVTEDPRFSEWTHFVKLDEDMHVVRPFDFPLVDYAGRVYGSVGNRRWHIGRCPGSIWNNRPYDGIFVPYCLGGYSYVISRAAAAAAVKGVTDPSADIYEDLMLGKILRVAGIIPTMIPKLSDYIRPI
jgi:hypothetical protein